MYINHSSPLFKILQQPLTATRIKPNSGGGQQSLATSGPAHLSNLIYPIYDTPATKDSLLFLKHPGRFHTEALTWVPVLTDQSQFQGQLLRQASPATLPKAMPPQGFVTASVQFLLKIVDRFYDFKQNDV